MQAPARKRHSFRWLVIALLLVLLIAGGGGAGAYEANVSLSAKYSPQRVVTEYFAAQERADVAGMMANATYIRGAGSFPQFFDKAAVKRMVALQQNTDIRDFRVVTIDRVDDSTSRVTVSMTQMNSPRTHTYTVKKDRARRHDFFYYSWRIQIPFVTIGITVPFQAGPVEVDGLGLPTGVLQTSVVDFSTLAQPPSRVYASVQVMEGYHEVTLVGTDFYAETSLPADGLVGDSKVTFDNVLRPQVLADAASSVKSGFGNVACDANRSYDCPNHMYSVPAGYYDILPAPGGDIQANSSWISRFSGDPTAGMTLVVTDRPGEVTASGKCAMTLTVDESSTYRFIGTWTGTLYWDTTAGFESDLTLNCDSRRA
jgi:hypothetical protein